ncbi:MAG: M48 family metallopeptidase [Candidatus Zixiibacteriota bacterium]
MFKLRRVPVFALVFLSLILACTTTGPGGKKSFIVIPTSQEVTIGQGMAHEVEQTEKTLPDTLWQNYLARVGRKITSVCDRNDLEYHFKVIESDQINAFAAPGGYVYFYTGLLREMHSEAEMAAVMAHEISHVVGRHGIKRLQATLGVALAYQLAFGDGGSQAVNTAVGVGMGLIFAGYSRDNEREADRFGIQYMVKAGYDPQGAVAMFNTLARLGGSGSNNVYEKLSSSHPETAERIQNAEAEIAAMQPLPSGLTSGGTKYAEMLKRLPPKAPAKK